MDGDQRKPAEQGFGGRSVVTFESRRAVEMSSLIARHGGVPMSAPALREVALESNGEALTFARDLRKRSYDLVILMTGTGTRALADEVAPELDRAAFADALRSLPASSLIARGPKPAAALRELGVREMTIAPEPNTWREVLAAAVARGSLAGARIAVQEHGAPSADLYAALERAGAHVTPVRVYKWALPEDTTPLRRALRDIAEGRAAIALFTSRAQVEHAIAVAEEEGIAAAVKDQLGRGLVASIGPVCSEALRAEGLPPDVEPDHPKMGHLVKSAAERAAAILNRRGSTAAR